MADTSIPSPPPPPPTLDDLIDAWAEGGPGKYKPILHIALATAPYGRGWGASLGPIDLVDGITATAIWRSVARRCARPEHLVARIHARAGHTQMAAALDLSSEDLWRYWRGDPSSPSPSPSTSPSTSPSPPPSPPQLPPTDLLSVVLASMAQQQQVLLALLSRQAEPRSDPAVDVLRSEIIRLQAAMSGPQTNDREFYLDMGKKLGGGDAGLGAAATLLAGPLERVAGAVEKTASAKAEALATSQQVLLLEAETKKIAAEESLLRAAHETGQQHAIVAVDVDEP